MFIFCFYSYNDTQFDFGLSPFLSHFSSTPKKKTKRKIQNKNLFFIFHKAYLKLIIVLTVCSLRLSDDWREKNCEK